LTVHDVAVLDHPEWFAPAFRLVYRLFWPELLPRVAQIITVSEFSRSRILAHFPALATPIDVVQNGVDTDFFSRLLGEYTAPRQPYCLTVGSLQPRKNLRTLISYWQENAAELPRLVVVGSPARSFARQPGFAKHEKIDYVGRISDRRLLDYYRGARALLLTSHYEGSSLPGLEAMAAGCPVLASDIEAHREVLGAAAGYFPAHDLSGLAEHIRKLNPSEPGRAVQIDAGSIRSRSFSWERTAQHTSAVIQRAIDA
jgi:glycosyltransferase involved in cell wall biosynthesis